MSARGASALVIAPEPAEAPGAATSLIFAFPSGERTHPCETPKPAGEPKGSRDFWTHLKVAELEQLWGMGLSHGAIAIVMGLSKGKVSAKLDRLGLERAKPVVDGRSFAAQPPRALPLRMSDIPGRRVPMFACVEVDGEAQVVVITGCKAPTGYADGEHLFCGEDREPGKPYCLDHCRIAYRPAKAEDGE